MNPAPVNTNEVDQLLSDFFKSKVAHPWPAAPVPSSHTLASPSSLSTPYNRRSAADTAANRARLTLAASIAFLLGTCWYLSPGSGSAERGPSKPGPAVGPNLLENSSAKTPDAFNSARGEKAKTTKDPMTGFQPGPIRLP